MRRALLVLTLFFASLTSNALARDIAVATWNLGWHMDRALLAQWIDACNETYELDKVTKKYHPSTEIGARFGWDIDVFAVEGWNVNFPVCNVYGAGKEDFGFTTIRVTPEAYDKRIAQIQNFIASSVQVDIIAFQEVSGKEAVLEILPGGGADYEVCSFTGFKVQRLAIAWKKSLGTQISCQAEEALTLKDIRPFKDQPRPGLLLALDVGGTRLHVMNVHLKSSCVSPLGGNLLAGDAIACQILHDQVVPLETWIDRETAVGDRTILLGDFNRNFWHEVEDDQQVRTDGGNPTTPLPEGVRVNSLFEEVIDGNPASSNLTMLKELCPANELAALICEIGEARKLETPEVDVLRFNTHLGCRNPIGLDHILYGPGVTAQGDAIHAPIGKFGGSRHPNNDNPVALLAIADHCPLVARLSF